ncbi:MAG: GHKL domain-containing protein [Pseudarcicella sp.]|nr:GHKL domain-containing protein [Pseudarcicella sp.]MBP6411388.1 GHKL domain-containing protein [Pseudarcicella sp.]
MKINLESQTLRLALFAERQARIKAEIALKVQQTALSKLKLSLNTQKRINRNLDDFAQVLTHDLKAPLRGISNLSAIIRQDFATQLNQEAKVVLDLLVNKSVQMQCFIESVLKYSKESVSTTELKCQKTSAIVSEVIAMLSPPINFEIIIADDLPNVYYEEVKLRQVFQNLISNAIKFNNKEFPKIEIGYRIKNGNVIFTIKDNGIGIEPNNFKKIFNVFQTTDSENETLNGLGLAIVKRIVQQHGGEIFVKSKSNVSTVFTFTVPY